MTNPSVKDTTGKAQYSLANDSNRKVKNTKSENRTFVRQGEEL